MFKLNRPCATCPFRVGQTYFLGRDHLREIMTATAFQCHGTVDYDNFDDPRKRSGDHPQQCAGLMSLLHRAGRPNQIMRAGMFFGHFDPERLDHTDVYPSIFAAARAHWRLDRKPKLRNRAKAQTEPNACTELDSE
jgi:hypothetical protein